MDLRLTEGLGGADFQSKCDTFPIGGERQYLLLPHSARKGVAALSQYHQFTHHERYLIALMRRQRLSAATIARRLGRHVSSIYREVKRNASTYDGHYGADKAHSYAVARRSRCRRKPQYSQQEWAVVDELLRLWWSPQQIAAVLAQLDCMQISMQSIYRHVRRDRRRGGALWRCLRIVSKFARKRYRSQVSRGVLPGKRHISERPAEVELRQEQGHWEGDTVMGSDQRHCLLTLVERATGFVIIKKLSARTKDQATAAALRALREHPGRFKTITFDNGTEFHDYKRLERRRNLRCYFATPYHSWERGSNENVNGLIRQYLPKGTCMRAVTQTDCNSIARSLNHRPRKRHNYKTPAALLV